MSAGINISQAGDLLVTTLARMPRGKFISTFKYQSYPLCERFFGDGRIRAKSGTRFEMRTRLKENESARGVRLYQATAKQQTDVMSKCFVEWTHAEGYANWDVREFLMNEGDNEDQIIELIETRRQGAYESMANYFEDRGFLAPINSSDDLNPTGFGYWVNMIEVGSTDTVGGFNGKTVAYLDGTTTTTKGGIDCSIADNGRFRNWNATVTSTTLTPGVLDLLRTAVRRVRFKAPRGMGLKENPTGARKFCMYWNQDYADQYQRLVNAGPDDREGNFSPFSGDLPFMDVDTCGSPALDGLASNPIYGINHNHLYVIALKGAWMQEDKPVRDRAQRHVWTMGLDCSYAMFCDNPRSCFVVHNPR